MASILAVEDDEVIRRHISRLAAHNGWEIQLYATAEEGFVRFCELEAPVDLVLMDIATPGAFDGLECARRIRAKETAGGAHTPIIALTAYAYPEDKIRCLEAGMDDYLSKPFTMGDFAAIVLKWIKPPVPPT